MVPFLKWAGGKRQLLDRIVPRMPQEFIRYFEPFVGGGAVLFELQPEGAVINDINAALINAYQMIEDDVRGFIELVDDIDAHMGAIGREYYYAQRALYNDKILRNEYDMELAALFVFLNKHCFNGLYRVNRNGLFNVPYNNSVRPSIDHSVILSISEYLHQVTILQGDFEDACIEAAEGDFVFLDSPYAPLNPTSFEAYTEEGFDLDNHRRLARLYEELTERGCFCMLTNHNTPFINELYGNRGYRIEVVDVRRSINADAHNRVGEEVIICNY